jgi:hypothetical protein
MSVATLGRVDLSALRKKAPDKTKTEYPTIEDPRAIELAGLILKLADEAEAVTANLEINKAELRSLVVPEYFRRFAGRTEIPPSMAVHADGRELLVSMTSKYKKVTDEDALISLIGEDSATRYLKPSFTLEIDSSKIPRGEQQNVVNALLSILETYGCADALEAKENVTPIEEFHTVRHTAFTPELNMKIENFMPMTVAVKTKGRK